MTVVSRLEDALGRGDTKPWKSTLFQGDHLFLGVNCLEPGQVQAVHDHAGSDKFYLVHEGTGFFQVGADRFDAGPGSVIWAKAGVPHGVENRGLTRLSLLIGIAPGPPPKR